MMVTSQQTGKQRDFAIGQANLAAIYGISFNSPVQDWATETQFNICVDTINDKCLQRDSEINAHFPLSQAVPLSKNLEPQ